MSFLWRRCTRPFGVAAQIALLASCNAAYAHSKAAGNDNDAVTITAPRNPVDKSYRRMAAGMDLFEKRRHLAPAASLR